jgi:hypothetical protein
VENSVAEPPGWSVADCCCRDTWRSNSPNGLVARSIALNEDAGLPRRPGPPGHRLSQHRHAPEVFYEFKIRNESGIAVPFDLEIILFDDLQIQNF